MFDKLTQWTYSGGNAERCLTKDEILDDVTLYWLTNSASSSARLYWENNNNFSSPTQRTTEIKVPVAVTVFPGAIYQAPRTLDATRLPQAYLLNEVKEGDKKRSSDEFSPKDQGRHVHSGRQRRA
ncbi:hypothetical protein [Variovorax sp. GT1P44]|uniref:hypothetical protein n=1 Tax=Variovorax sp. GT1P44 TaxID=3443742 RepID=UPI003F45D968